jgi:hypothetical protein
MGQAKRRSDEIKAWGLSLWKAQRLQPCRRAAENKPPPPAQRYATGDVRIGISHVTREQRPPQVVRKAGVLANAGLMLVPRHRETPQAQHAETCDWTHIFDRPRVQLC